MLVHLPSKRVVLHLSNPARVTTVIPTARAFEYKGNTLVAVPHRLDEIRVLRNLGIRAPSPILHHYDWPRGHRYEPFIAQRETAQFLTLNPRAFVLNDLGTGKTLAALWAFHFLKSIGVASKLLVASPLSTMERVWADEVFRHFPDLTVSVLYGPKEKRLKMLANDADVYVVNHHGLRVLEKDLIERTDIDTFVIDEIATFRNASTELWKSANRVAQGRARLWGMTGTPTPNGPTDAWAQCRLISPERVPRYFGKFRDMVMKQNGPFKWTAREGATDQVFEAMQPAIRFTRDQCVDLPPAIYQPRHVEMTPEQKSAYKDMVNKLHMEFKGDEVQAVNEAVKMSKLVQIACGVVYGVGGEEVVLPNKPRIDAVAEIIEQAATKTIVFVPFKAVLHYVADELEKLHLGKQGKTEFVKDRLLGNQRVGRISGDVSKSERDRIFYDFQQGGTDILVAQPAAMSHGLTLTAANTIIWYAPVTSQETYSQANGRITRPGQKQTQFIVNVEGSAVERRIYDRLQNKQKMQGLLLDIIQEAGA